jgi:hypothetical protein
MADLVNDMEPELLIDHTGDLRVTLTEAADPIMKPGKSNRILIKGQYALTDTPTQNKRLYREHLWKREFGRLSESIKRRRVYGELDHPQDGRTKLQRASHIITKLEVRGNQVYGEAEVIDTPNGRILKAIAEASGEVGISSRGFGSVKTRTDGVQEVQEDFKLDTFDFVADPATRTAYPKVFREARETIESLENEDMDLETLRRDYPGLVTEIAEMAREGNLIESTGTLSDAEIKRLLSETEERTTDRLKEKFSNELRRQLEVMREEVEGKVRSDLLSDPEVAASKQVVERIASMVQSFGMQPDMREKLNEKDAEIERLKEALADKELSIAKVTREAEEAAKMAKEAAYALHLERTLGEAKDKEAIKALVGDLMEYENTAAIDEKVKTVRAELERRAVPDEGQTTEWEERLSKIEQSLQEEREARQLAEEKAARHEAQAKKALAKAEREVAARIVTEEIAQLDEEKDADLIEDLRTITEDTTDPEEVRKAIADKKREALVEVEENHRTLDEDEADRIRARVGRGKQRSLEEDTHGGGHGGTNGSRPNGAGAGPLAEFGMDVSRYERLSGTGKPS